MKFIFAFLCIAFALNAHAQDDDLLGMQFVREICVEINYTNPNFINEFIVKHKFEEIELSDEELRLFMEDASMNEDGIEFNAEETDFRIRRFLINDQFIRDTLRVRLDYDVGLQLMRWENENVILDMGEGPQSMNVVASTCSAYYAWPEASSIEDEFQASFPIFKEKNPHLEVEDKAFYTSAETVSVTLGDEGAIKGQVFLVSRYKFEPEIKHVGYGQFLVSE